MRAGRLRHMIQIEEAVTTADSSGDPVTVWTAIGTTRADILPIRGREAVFGNQTLSEFDTKIIVRWSPLTELITAKHRLTHQGTIFNVVSPAHVAMGKEEIEILCKSGVNDG